MIRRVLFVPLFFALLASARCQWKLQESHATADLTGISAIGRDIAWASGSGGTILRTIDGGNHWQQCTTPPNARDLDFRAVQARNEDVAVVMSSGMGDRSRLYKTVDGCRTWKLVFANANKESAWSALQIGDASDGGVLIGLPVEGRFAIFETRDGGDTWEAWGNNKYHASSAERVRQANARRGEILLPTGSGVADLLGRSHFAFVTGGPGGSRMLFSEPNDPFDNGVTYRFTAVSLPFTSTQNAGAFALADRPDNVYGGQAFMVVGGNPLTPDAAGSSVFLPARKEKYLGKVLVLGRERQKVVKPQTPLHGWRSAVAFDEKSNTWIAVGPNGTDASTDDGLDWRSLIPTPQEAPDADRHWSSLALPFAVGTHGRIGLLDTKLTK